jgi:hypothetical protein
MTFDLTNAPDTFQRFIEKVLRNLNWKQCVPYLDGFSQNKARLELVMMLFKTAKVKINLQKCKFCVEEV